VSPLGSVSQQPGLADRQAFQDHAIRRTRWPRRVNACGLLVGRPSSPLLRLSIHTANHGARKPTLRRVKNSGIRDNGRREMRMKAALVIIVISATPALAQGITNNRDANGNLPRDKGISTNTNPTNANASRSSQNLSAPPSQTAPPPAKPTAR
jgi:hypothetical protein